MINRIKKLFLKFFRSFLVEGKIFLIALFLLAPFISNRFRTGDDFSYHLFNTMSLASSWNFFNTFQIKILDLACNSFGYGSPIFYPQLSHFVIAFFAKILAPIHLNMIYAIKVALFFVVFFSGFFMYKLMFHVSKNQNVSFVAALFYMSSPYFLSDVFIRTSYAEAFIFPFLPLVFLGICYLLEKNYRLFYLCFVIGYVGLIHSHLVMCVYITLFLVGVFLLNFKRFLKKDIIWHFLIATIIVLLISSPFLVPLLQHKFLGNYAVFQVGFMTASQYVGLSALNLYDFFAFVPEYHISFAINLISVVLFVFCCYRYQKFKKHPHLWLFKSGIILGIFCLFMISKFFPWKFVPEILAMIQFPWRLEIILIFFVSVVSSLSLLLFDKKLQELLVIICLVVSFLYSNEVISKLTFSPVYSEYFEHPVGERAGSEYYPVKAIEHLSYIDHRSSDVIPSDKNVKVKILKDETPDLKFVVSNVSKPVTLELPRIYYLGYQIIQENSHHKMKKIKYKENSKGLIGIEVSKDCTISVLYTGTLLANIANWISFITIISFLFWFVYSTRKNKGLGKKT